MSSFRTSTCRRSASRSLFADATLGDGLSFGARLEWHLVA